MNFDKSFYGCFGHLSHRTVKPRMILIHHTATATPERTRSALKGNKYSTHFEIDQHGNIYQYADTDRVCVHGGSVNWQSIGIDLTHKTDTPFPHEQIKALKELCEYLCAKYEIPFEIHEALSGIYPHNAIGQTACPQDAVKDLIALLES